TASKTIASQALGAGAFRYVGFKELLETEAGFTPNEPDLIAVQQAIEKAVYALLMGGIEQKLWYFGDAGAGAPYYGRYYQEREGQISPEQAQALAQEARRNPARPAKIVHPKSASA